MLRATYCTQQPSTLKLHFDHTLAVLLDYDIKQQSLQEGLAL